MNTYNSTPILILATLVCTSAIIAVSAAFAYIAFDWIIPAIDVVLRYTPIF